jgi:hypothetical protein
MIHYKSSAFIKTAVEKESACLEKAIKDKAASETKLNDIGIKLYDQFKSFVMNNKDLYDMDFVDKLTRMQFSVKSVKFVEEKKAIRLEMNISPEGIVFVIVSLLFISDPAAYRITRVRRKSFGKDVTMKEVEKHYDSEIANLMNKIERLKKEKNIPMWWF